jgi:phosphoribosylamine--glycine ligase
MNILIVGSGGREHALGWKLKQSPYVKKIFFAPGNGGAKDIGENVPIKATEIKALLQFAKKNKINLTVVGPEDPLSLGIVDLFEKHNLAIFGPSKKASRLESSKAWAASFMNKYKIPQPISFTFKDYKKAITFTLLHDMSRYVIKASGLALGKGVILPKDEEEAKQALKQIMVNKEFGEAGAEVVIQERLIGEEVSLLAVTDGNTILPFVSAQDHKRIFDDDKGPNTGGMGAYAPVPFVSKKLIQLIHKTILQPTIDGMKKEQSIYKGILYAGLMITSNGPKVLEYNVRFGDPETQPLMMLLKSDLFPLLFASYKGTLKNKKITFFKQAAISVVLASGGYPGTYEKGAPIMGLPKKHQKQIEVFHAGTAVKNKKVVTSGGRVLTITAIGRNMKEAIKKAYGRVGKRGVHFKGMQYRHDIGKKATINHYYY